EADLGTLLSAAFAREKTAEDSVLSETLGAPIVEAPTDKSKRMNVVPPTALAFEHTAVLAEDVPSEDELTDPGRVPPHVAEGTPTPGRRPFGLTRLKNRARAGPGPALGEEAPYAPRRSLGVHFDAHEPVIERSLVEEIDALSDEVVEPEPLSSTYQG